MNRRAPSPLISRLVSAGPPAAVFVCAAAAFLYHLRPALWTSDFAAFIVYPTYLTVSHYPGYPFPNLVLYLPHLVGGDPAVTVGAFNALLGAAALTVVYGLWRSWGIGRAPAAAFALALAFTPAFGNWAAAGPEVHMLEVLTAAVVMAWAVTGTAEGDARFVLAAFFVWALALGNRNTFAVYLLWPVAAAFFVRRRTLIWCGAAAVAAGVSVYVYYALRQGCFGDQWQPPPPFNGKIMAAYLFNTKGQGFIGGPLSEGKPALPLVAAHLVFQMKYGALAFAVVGLATFWRKNAPRVAWGVLLLIATAFNFLVYLIYQGTPTDQYLLLPLVGTFTFAAAGADALTRLLNRARRPATIFAALLFTLPAYNLYANRTLINHRADRAITSRDTEAWRLLPFETAVAGEHWNFMPFVYFRYVERARPDTTFFSVNVTGWEHEISKLGADRLSRFGPRGGSWPPWRPGKPAYIIQPYPKSDSRPYLFRVFLPSRFFGREVDRIPAGGGFVAVLGDMTPAFAKKVPRDGYVRFYRWRPKELGRCLESKRGTAMFIAGRRDKNGWELRTRVRWGPHRGECTWAPGTRVRYEIAGDPPYGMSSLELDVGGERYRQPRTGILLIPLRADGRPAGPAARYYGYDIVNDTIFKILYYPPLEDP